MSNIPYPHIAQIRRTAPQNPPVQDDYGRNTDTVEGTLAEVPAWFQSISAREQAQLTSAGATVLTERIFMDPTDVKAGDFLIRKDTGDRIQIIGDPMDPDGTGDHLEINGIRVTEVFA